jgi:hypothetical protein
MVQPDCEPIMQTIQSLTRQILELDYGIEELEAEALRLHLPQYFASQREVDHLLKRQHALQNEWNKAMSEFAICRSTYPAHYLLWQGG